LSCAVRGWIENIKKAARAEVVQEITVIDYVLPDSIELHEALIHQQDVAAVWNPDGETVVFFSGRTGERHDDFSFSQDISRILSREVVGIEDRTSVKIESIAIKIPHSQQLGL
jgi:tRNA(Leu) C34 or U34 (ribose-2'-O)-methylase TrmL